MLRSSEKTAPHQNLLNRGFVWLFQTCLYAYLNEGEKVRQCYSYLKVMIQAHLHVGFSIIFFIKRWTFNELKGYLRYKTITSQNVPSEAQIKNFFISNKSYVLFSSFCIFNRPMIYQICDVTMNISTRDNVHFWIYLLNHNYEVTKLGQLIDMSKGNNF